MTVHLASVEPEQDRGSDLQDVPDRAQIAYLRHELEASQQRVGHLEAALVNARKIGAAIGVAMATEKLTYDQAFAFLSLVSQRGNEKLSSVAERVLITGSAAPWPR